MDIKKLPENWTIATLGQIANWASGGTPKKSISSYYGGSIPFIKTGDLNNGEINDVKEYLTDEGVKNSSAKIFPKGSICIAMYGATIGKTGVFGMDAATNQACAVAKTFLDMDKFLHYYLKSQKQNFIDQGKGGAQPNISQTIIKKHKLFLPPLTEQDRIVAKIDVLMAQVKSMQKSLVRIPQLLKDFRQQVLTQAVTGKLTEKFQKQHNLKLWRKENIKNLSSKVGSGSTPRGGQAAYQDEGIPLIRSMNVHFNGIKYEGLAYLNDEQAKKLKNVTVETDDVLLNITGASIGRVCLAPKELNGGRVNQHVCIIRTNHLIKPSFLRFYLASPTIQNFIINENYGTTRQALTKTQTLSLVIPIPELIEQEEIVRRVESLFSKADVIKKQFQSLKTKIDTLPQSILHKAFKGELVAQLASDGDAQELLREIEKLKSDKK